MNSNKINYSINYIKTIHKAETEMQREFFRKKKSTTEISGKFPPAQSTK